MTTKRSLDVIEWRVLSVKLISEAARLYEIELTAEQWSLIKQSRLLLLQGDSEYSESNDFIVRDKDNAMWSFRSNESFKWVLKRPLDEIEETTRQ